jgi:hypothetical protein
MSANKIVKKTAAADLDGFATGYSAPATVGDGGASPNSGWGIKLKFGLDARWTDPSGDEITSVLVALDVINRVHKWPGDGGAPVETIDVRNGQWPDIVKLNDSCRDEWFERFGKLIGPWRGEHVLLLAAPTTAQTFWWASPTETIGSCIAIRNLVTAVQRMRQFRGEAVFPIIRLTHAHMNTAYGGRERPDLRIERFVSFGDGGAMKTIEPPSMGEEIRDSIPF